MTATDRSEASVSSEREESRGSGLGTLAIVFLAALACFLPLPANSPLAGTEGHRAITAHQMVTSGEWLVPRMFGRVYLAKPPLHYWIIGTFETLSGQATPFIWRLPSAVEGAILATILCWLGGRWFGSVGGIVSGLCYVGLFAMWGQDRGADIDLTNALVSTLAAICLLEMQFGLRQSWGGAGRVCWITLGGLMIGASFLTKGPCGLPPILGALIWIAIVRIRQRRAWRLIKPEVWLPLVIGIAIFGTYAWATYHYIGSHHMAADLTGVQEGTEDLHPHDWTIARAIGIVTLPLIMFLYAMPISLALPLSFVREIPEGAGEGKLHSRKRALAATILLAWAVCFVSGMHLPRYAFVTLPLLCPLAGAVAAGIPRMQPGFERLLAAIAGISAALFAAAVLATSIMLLRHHSLRVLVIITGAIALPLAGIILRGLLRPAPQWRALYLLPIILLCLAQNSGWQVNYDRIKRSSLTQGQEIRSITGPDAHLFTCMMVLDQPEMFYYSGLATTATDGDTLDWRNIPLGSWVVLEDPELEIWKREVPGRIKKTYAFIANKNQGYLVWYSD